MDFHVFDTYVKAKDGHIMHFDVITDNKEIEKEMFPDDMDADEVSTQARKLRTLRQKLQKTPIDLDLG